jgi:colanic acid biosynthesis glycosyl transferase WcaI
MARISIFYHFLHPDPVVSSVHLSELCVGLADRGWEVRGYACNRGSGALNVTYPPKTTWKKVTIQRLWRPGWKQNSGAGRLLNAAWMVVRWSALAVSREAPPDIILMGSDPVLSVFIAPVWRLLHPQIKIVHWCFDLYPEAAYADGILAPRGLASRVLKGLLKHSYSACDLVVDIGPCMRSLVLRYDPNLRAATLVPWALSEPSAALRIACQARAKIFGQAKLALMYSGTLGRAHSFDMLLRLMRRLRNDPVHLAFSVKGNRADHLREAVEPEDKNISFVPFAPSALLEERLAAADIHVVSLREEWTGTVVPSKFFGALAVGRPILFCGSHNSAIALWIVEHKVGWVLDSARMSDVAAQILRFAADDSAMRQMRVHCHQIYQHHFSRETVLDAWHRELTSLVSAAESRSLGNSQSVQMHEKLSREGVGSCNN